MKIKELKCLMEAGMISVDNDNLQYVIDYLKANGFKVTKWK